MNSCRGKGILPLSLLLIRLQPPEGMHHSPDATKVVHQIKQSINAKCVAVDYMQELMEYYKKGDKTGANYDNQLVHFII